MYYRWQPSNLANYNFDSKLESKVVEQFKSLETSTTSSVSGASSDTELSNVRLKFCGGTPPLAGSLKLAELTPKMFADWISSIDKNPIELQYYIKLEPYYLLLDDAQKSSLRNATKHYFVRDVDKPLTRSNVSVAIRGVSVYRELDDYSIQSYYEDDDIIPDNESDSTPTRDVHESTSMRILNAMWLPFHGILKKMSSVFENGRR